MFGKFLFILYLQVFTVFCYNYTKPDKPCNAYDNVCIVKMVADIFSAAINGDPSEGFKAIDPMHHDVIIANLPTVNFTLKDVTVIGYKQLQVSAASISDHDSVYITITIPHYEMSGKYEINGIFLNTPIMGNGKFNIKATDIKMNLEAMKYYYKKDNGVYLKVDRFGFPTELMGKLHVDIENLFSANKELADSALQMLNSNDKMLVAAWNPPITRANLNKVFDNINRVHEDVLLKDLVVEDLSKKYIH